MQPEQREVLENYMVEVHAGPGGFTLVMVLPPHEHAAPVGQVVRTRGSRFRHVFTTAYVGRLLFLPRLVGCKPALGSEQPQRFMICWAA